MKKNIEIDISPDSVENQNVIRNKILKNLHISSDDLTSFKITRRTIDARGKSPVFRLWIDVFINETESPDSDFLPTYHEAKPNKRVIIVGFGPAGMFGALKLLEYGIKPIILERGKDVRLRRKDLRDIQQFDIVNPDSNYCFGEGGAGTYSDGKLYTRSTKRGDIKKTLSILVAHGAHPDILIDAHPHIGSNKLPKVVQSIRETILQYGGEIHFDHRVSEFIIENNSIKGVRTQNGNEFSGDAVLLATGHSARDIFELLDRQKIHIETKPFALGVRVEHPQALIDEIQYKCKIRNEHLPASSYSLVEQINGKGVYSFCMCPGGIIVPAATTPGEIVVNGMSMSRRDSKFANSGMVTTIENEDLLPFAKSGSLAGIDYQKSVEQRSFEMAHNTQKAPAHRLIDFVEKRNSKNLPDSSYIPGLTTTDLWQVLPNSVAERLQKGFMAFGKKMKGYLTNEALIVATESRTSSPVKIPRDTETLEHVSIKRLFPSGEGAGYAGGIISAAMDGERCADSIAQYIFKSEKPNK